MIAKPEKGTSLSLARLGCAAMKHASAMRSGLLMIFSLAGTKAGTHSLIWNAGNIPSGDYFIKAQAGGRNAVKQITLVK